MKIHILYTEKWDEILDAIKEAEEYLKDFDVEISSTYVDMDVTYEALYETTYSWAGLKRIPTKSFKNSVIKVLGNLYNKNAQYHGIIVDKDKSLAKATLNGQANSKLGTFEIYAKRTTKKRYGMPHNTYTLVHEILHFIEDSLGKDGALHAYLETKPKNLDAFIATLKPELPKKKYKHFTEEEVVGLTHDFILKLDQAREIAGIPFAITSGYRSQAKNKAVGGVPNSLHTKGLAVDIRCRNSEERYKIVKGALQAGINEITVYTRSGHVHLADDVEQTLSVINK